MEPVRLVAHYRRVAPWLVAAFGPIPIETTPAPGSLVDVTAGRDTEHRPALGAASLARAGALGAGVSGGGGTPGDPDAAAFARISVTPGDPASPDVARLGALAVRSGLASLGLGGALVSDGRDGFRVYVPLVDAPAFERLLPALRRFVDRVAREHPGLAVTERVAGERVDLAVISVEANTAHASAALPYTPVGAGSAFAMPLRWSELGTFEAEQFEVEALDERLATGDVFGDVVAPLRGQRSDAIFAHPGGHGVLPGLKVRER